MKNVLRLASVLLLASAALAASAQVAPLVDFEDLAGKGQNDGFFADYGSSVTSGGLNFRSADLSAFYSNGPTYGAYYTGSISLGQETVSDATVVTRAGGGAFDLYSLQVAPYRNGSGATRTLDFSGQRANGTSVSQSVAVTYFAGLQTIDLVGFTGLTSFTLPSLFDSSGSFNSAYQIDNLRTQPTPTPEPSALAALGLGAVALLRRRDRA